MRALRLEDLRFDGSEYCGFYSGFEGVGVFGLQLTCVIVGDNWFVFVVYESRESES